MTHYLLAARALSVSSCAAHVASAFAPPSASAHVLEALSHVNPVALTDVLTDVKVHRYLHCVALRGGEGESTNAAQWATRHCAGDLRHPNARGLILRYLALSRVFYVVALRIGAGCSNALCLRCVHCGHVRPLALSRARALLAIRLHKPQRWKPEAGKRVGE